MSEMTRNSDLVELGIDEFADVEVAEPVEEVPEAQPEIDEEAIKATFEELTGKKPRANAKIETLIATIEELE